MNSKDTITVIFYDKSEASEQQHLFPGLIGLQARVIELKKDVLVESLGTLISDVHDVLGQLPVSSGKSKLETISVSVELGAQGGAAMVVSGSAEVTNAITLTFKIVEHE